MPPLHLTMSVQEENSTFLVDITQKKIVSKSNKKASPTTSMEGLLIGQTSYSYFSKIKDLVKDVGQSPLISINW